MITERKPIKIRLVVRQVRTLMHVEIFKPRWRGNVPGILGACANRDLTHLVRGHGGLETR